MVIQTLHLLFYVSDRSVFLLEERENYFAGVILNAVENSIADEILIVAHSAGTIVAVDVIHRVLELLAKNNSDKKISLITLGQCIPTVSFNPNAHFFRKPLKNLWDQMFAYLGWIIVLQVMALVFLL